MPGTTENAVLAALEAVVRDHGWDVAAHPQRLRAVLSDVLGSHADEHRGALDAIVVSADEGVPFDIRDAGRSGIAAVSPALVDRLTDWGLSRERAGFVVDAWAALLPETTVQPAPPVATEPPPPAVTAPPPPAVTEPPPDEPVAKKPEPSAPVPVDPTALPPREPAAEPVTALPPQKAAPTPATELPAPVRKSSRAALLAGATVVALVVGGVAAAMTLTGDDNDKDPGSTPTSQTPDEPSGAPPASGTELVSDSAAKPPKAGGVFAMAARRSGVRVTHVGDVTETGSGDAARSAPEGGRLISFRLGEWACDEKPCTPWSEAGLSVRVGTDVRPLPTGGPTYVVAVPAGTPDVELTLVADKVTQTLSLPDGEPGADNFRVLARDSRTLTLGKRFNLTENTSPGVDYGDGQARPSVRRQAVLRSVSLEYFIGAQAAPGPGRAWLRVRADFTRPQISNKVIPFRAEEIQLRLPSGRVVSAKDFDDSTDVNIAIEVPADLDRAVLIFGGTRQATGYTVNIPTHEVKLELG